MFPFSTLKAAYYYRQTIGTISVRSNGMADLFGLTGVSEYANFASNVTHGVDYALSLYRRFSNGLYVRVGTNGNWGYSYYARIVEDDNLNESQQTLGKPTDSYWGYICLGKYETQEQISTLPALMKDLKIGDLIYYDENQNGQLTSWDRVILGNTAP